MGEELRLVGGHVHVNGAIAFTPFTGQAKVQRFFHVFVTPSVVNGFALQHLPQQVRPPSRGMLFFPRHHVAWADGLVVRSSRGQSAAFAESDAAHRGMRKAPVIVGIAKMRRGLRRVIVRPESQVFV